jgi:hypothetical protein
MMKKKNVLMLFICLYVLQGTVVAEIGGNTGPFDAVDDKSVFDKEEQVSSFASRTGMEATLADGDPPGQDGGPGTAVPLDNYIALILTGGILIGLYGISERNKQH